MKIYKKKPWTVRERQLLADNYFNTNIKEISAMLPERSEQSIRNQVSYLRKRGYRFTVL